MMKKLVSLVAALALACGLAACSSGAQQQAPAATSASSEAAPAEAASKEAASTEDASGAVSGTYTGKAMGMGGTENMVEVELTLTDSVITDVKIKGDGETEGVGSVVVESFPEVMIANNTINIDAITGATVTSDAVKEAAGKALKDAGLNPDDYQTAAAAAAATGEVASSYDTDVVIIGAGGAGMTAAIVAKDAGREVLIVESQAMVGGNSVRSTGGMNAAETEDQDENDFGEEAGVEKTLKSAADSYADNAAITELAATVQEQWDEYQANPEGYFDSEALMELDTMIGGKGINDPELVKILAENSSETIEWLRSIGADLTDVAAFGGASVKRIHRPLNDEGKTVSVGAYLVPILEQNVTDRGIEILFNTTATKILTDDSGAAVGVEAENNGNSVTINAKAVVIATGGFGGNLDMVVEYKPELEGFVSTNAPGSQGQGIEMGEAVGAATVDLEQIQIHPTVHVDKNGNANLITEGLRGDGAILVNKEGERFCDEVGTRDAVSAAEIAQTDGEVWLIVDQKMVDASAVIQGYLKKEFAFSGETWEELAEAIDAPADALVATMDKWHEVHAAKNDEEFGRTSFAADVPLDTAPYYAIAVTPGIHHTMGGLKINGNTEVLTEAGDVIPGLFAAGEVTGGVHGANRLGGNAVADITVFGQIAGQSASDYAK